MGILSRDIEKEMLDAGWVFEKRGFVEYWSFEDSGWMDFRDARKLHLSCAPNPPKKDLPMPWYKKLKGLFRKEPTMDKTEKESAGV